MPAMWDMESSSEGGTVVQRVRYQHIRKIMNIEKLCEHIVGKMIVEAESYYGEAESYLIKCETMLRQQQAEIEKLRSWVEMLVEVPFFNEIDHYRGIPVAILRKASEK